MPTYTATHIDASTTIPVATTNGQVVVESNSYSLENFVQSQRSENVIISNVLINTSDISQLSKPILFLQKDTNGKIEGKPKFPYVDNYAIQSQVILKGDDNIVFDGINSIQYEINPQTEIRMTFEIQSKGSYSDMLLKSINLDIMSLLAYMDKDKDLREAQEKV